MVAGCYKGVRGKVSQQKSLLSTIQQTMTPNRNGQNLNYIFLIRHIKTLTRYNSTRSKNNIM